MCYTLIRSLNKHNFLKSVCVWECIYWLLMICWILLMFYMKLGWPEEEETLVKHHPSADWDGEDAVESLKSQWENALYCHVSLSFGFIIATSFLMLGLIRKSRCLIVTWIAVNVMLGMTRIAVFALYKDAYIWLRYCEIYWIPKCFFFSIAILYCIELWGHQEDGVPLDHPILYSLEEDDARDWRGAHNYADSATLDVRETVVGVGVGSTVLRDDTLYKEYPMAYDVTGYEGKGVRVVDHPPYEHL